jgi:UDP-galactose transporter B1
MQGVKVLTAGGVGNAPRNSRGKASRRINKENNSATGNDVADPSTRRLGDNEIKNQAFQTGNSPDALSLEYEDSEVEVDENESDNNGAISTDTSKKSSKDSFPENELVTPVNIDDIYKEESQSSKTSDFIWLFVCFMGIMASFVCYGLLLEYTTSGGRKLHELSFLFVTSGLYTLTAAAGRYVRGEEQTTIPPSRFAILGLTSMGSTFTSVRSLRFVIYPIQVLAKSCKPVPVMLMGTLMGKRYDLRKYVNVVMIVIGVAFFMGGGDNSKGKDDDEKSSSKQFLGIILLFISLCFDGGTGAYEDKLMSVHSVQPFDLMYNIQLGKTILAGVSLLVLNQLHIFIQMCQEMGVLLIALGLSGAMGQVSRMQSKSIQYRTYGEKEFVSPFVKCSNVDWIQVFIFVTIAKFGALTCSIIGLARKITTLLASIYFYGHHLNGIQVSGLVISVTAMIMNFMGKSKKGGGHGHGHGEPQNAKEHEKEHEDEEMQKMLNEYRDEDEEEIELSRK